MSTLTTTLNPPYYAVIFTSIRTDGDNGYNTMAQRMLDLARQQAGFLGAESAREDIGITVSYWRSLDDIKAWKQNSEHLVAQANGKNKWYEPYSVRIAKVEKDYFFTTNNRD